MVLFVDMGELGELISVALVETMRIVTCAAGGDAEDGEPTLPGPDLDALAETQADLAIAEAVLHDESPDESVRRRLEMMLDGDLDPANDFVCDTGDEGGLAVASCGECVDPALDFI